MGTATPLPQLTRDQIQQIFKDPALVRAYDALQRALQYTPTDVDTLTTEVKALQVLLESVRDSQFVTLEVNPDLSNERTLAVDASTMTLADGGPGEPVTLASHFNVAELDGDPTAPVTTLILPNGTLTIAGNIATYTPIGGGLSPITDKTILANISGASAVPIGNTLSALLDNILGSTQGQLITRNGATWTVLNPGTAGNVLTTGGAGANVTWSAASGGGVQFTFSTAAPSTPNVGDQWVDANSGIEYQWVNDGTSTQWVEF